MRNPRDTLARVRQALARGGDDPFLIGYDVNEIQAFVTASSRPVVMLGASRTIGEFDRAQEQGSIFAGGGQGITVCRGREAAEKTSLELRRRFAEITDGDALVTAAVPLDLRDPLMSWRWLRQKLSIEKDAAPKPTAELPKNRAEQCASCGVRKATKPRPRKSDDGRSREERVCALCDRLIPVGGAVDGMAQSLNELSSSGRIAAVSADGNDFGTLFRELKTLESVAVVSAAVAHIFEEAREHARKHMPSRTLATKRTVPSIVSVAVGGDDIRAFVGEESALTYVQKLVEGLKSNAVQAARELRELEGMPDMWAKTCDRIANLGVGIGLVSSDSHFPAYRLLEYAHDLERSAKRFCAGGRRFALDFAVLRTGDEMTQGPPDRTAGTGDIRPVDFSGDGEPAAWRQARALARVPTAQLAIFAEAARNEPSPPRPEKTGLEDGEQSSERPVDLLTETGNLLRYQVARTKEWQAYYEECGADWTKPKEVERHRPNRGHFDLVRLLGGNHGQV